MCEICYSYCGKYEEQRILRNDAVTSGINLPTFRRNVLPARPKYMSRGTINMDAKGSPEIPVNSYQIARSNTPQVFFNFINLNLFCTALQL